MTRISISLHAARSLPIAASAALLLPLALLGGCAMHKPMAPMAATPAPAPAPMAMAMPSAGAKPIVLAKTVLPDGGTLEDGTLVTGKDGWAVHGTQDGVDWRYSSYDAGYLRVAGMDGVAWQHIQVGDAWNVRCTADGTGANAQTFCDVLRVGPVTPKTLTTGGLRVADHGVCAVSDNAGDGATIVVDGGAPHALAAPDLCESGDALATELLAGKTVTVTAHFAGKGPEHSVTFPTTGLKQALALRDWILGKYKSGDLSTE
jgi:hypothetical protein